MKKIFLIMIFFLVVCLAQAANDTISVNGFQFFEKKVVLKNEFNSTDTLSEFYRIENGKQPKYLLKHYQYSFSADCNNSFEDKGCIEVHQDSISFITHYFQKTGLDPIPLMRKQVYVVKSSGKLILVIDKTLSQSGEWINSKD